MSINNRMWLRLAVALVALSLLTSACTTQASNSEYFGKLDPPEGQVLRYISGSEPESLDPHIGTGQPEARVYMALYEGLVDYHPKTMKPIPAVAQSWEPNSDGSEVVFHLRKNARWSNGDQITAHDFVYSLRRGLDPTLAARNSYMAYYVKHAQPYNEGAMFVRDPQTGKFVTAAEVKPEAKPATPQPAPATPAAAASPSDAKPVAPLVAASPSVAVVVATTTNTAPVSEAPTAAAGENAAPDTPFHRFIHEPERLTVAGDEKSRQAEIKANPKLETALAGKELVPVKAEDIGMEAVDDYTLRITLTQPAPFFVDMMSHQFFKLVPRNAIEKAKKNGTPANWTQPANIVTCGPFKLKTWKPYNVIVVDRDPLYWDAARVKLNEIHFYPLEDGTTMMNLYKAGEVDAVYNHIVPIGWLDVIRPLKDYMDAPEVAIQYYQINTTKPPMNDRRVRKAFNMGIDKNALADWRRVVKPLTAFSPEGIFPGYPQPKGDGFNPEKAKQLLAEAGYKDASGKFDPNKFPIGEVELTYNTSEENKNVAEFIQAQWKQNLGLTVPLKNVEWKTFLASRAALDYKGFARSGWVGDYMDPFTFLNLFYTLAGDNGTGWWDPKYVQMLDDANRTLDPQARFAKLARAEAYLIDAQPVIPLYTNATNWMKKPYLKGMYPNPQTLHAWKFVYIEHDTAKWDRGVPDMSTPDTYGAE